MSKDQLGSTISATDVRATLGLDVPPTRRRWLWLALPLSIVALLVLAPKILPKSPGSRVRYQTAPVARGDLEFTITATGTVETLHTIEVGSEVTGRIQRVLVDANDRVKKGQLLAVIDPEQLRATVNENEAQIAAGQAAVRQAQATLEESRAAAERARKQAAEGLASTKDLESALATETRSQAALESAKANVAVAQATAAQARTKLGRATVLSPVDGVVLERDIEPGQTVTAGFSTPVMFKIAEDLSQMRLQVDIDEADVGRAKEGQSASFVVEAYPERSFPSRLMSLRFNPTTSSNVVTYKGILAVDNHEMLLRPGMTATATIVTGNTHAVLLVPNAALRFQPPKQNGPSATAAQASTTTARGERSVYVLDGEGKPKRVTVKVGASDGTHSEVVGESLPLGTQVIVDLEATS